MAYWGHRLFKLALAVILAKVLYRTDVVYCRNIPKFLFSKTQFFTRKTLNDDHYGSTRKHDRPREMRRMTAERKLKVPINPKLLFCLNKYMYNSEQNGAKNFDLGQNRNFL